MLRTRLAIIAVALTLIVGAMALVWRYQDKPAESEYRGTMTKIARVSGSIAVWHLEYRDRHYLVTSKGGIMILPRWVEGSAKVAKPLVDLGPRRHGPEPEIER